MRQQTTNGENSSLSLRVHYHLVLSTTSRLTVVHRKHDPFVGTQNSAFTSLLSPVLVFDWMCFLPPVTVSFLNLSIKLTANVALHQVTLPILTQNIRGSYLGPGTSYPEILLWVYSATL